MHHGFDKLNVCIYFLDIMLILDKQDEQRFMCNILIYARCNNPNIHLYIILYVSF